VDSTKPVIARLRGEALLEVDAVVNRVRIQVLFVADRVQGHARRRRQARMLDSFPCVKASAPLLQPAIQVARDHGG